MRVLGIETSCDETGVALVESGRGVLAHALHSQVDLHEAYGGVVPELASRDHVRRLLPLTRRVLAEAGLEPRGLDAIAYTRGPGLAGALLVGASVAEALAWTLRVPALPVHHLEGHLLSPLLTEPSLAFPFVALLVSGGHTQLMRVDGVGAYALLGDTLDDAAGEAFDKTAKLLGLGFPGGPAVEKAALSGDPSGFDLPLPLKGQKTMNFSFSGLKTALRMEAERRAPLTDADVAGLCAAFQETVAESVSDRADRAMARFEAENPGGAGVFVAAGGVAANTVLRAALEAACAARGWNFIAPPLSLCGDNAAMIGWAALERMAANMVEPLDVAARPRWPLDPDAEGMIGSGRKGAKA